MSICPGLFALEKKKDVLVSECFAIQDQSLVWAWRWKRNIFTSEENYDMLNLMAKLLSVIPRGYVMNGDGVMSLNIISFLHKSNV